MEKQGMIVILQDPEMHFRLCTELQKPIYKEEALLEGGNAILAMLETKQMTEKLSIKPDTISVEDLCTEKTVWTLSQAENLTVTLHIQTESGSIAEISWTP